MGGNIFLQVSLLLGITVSIAFIIRLLRQPLMVAYIVAGLVSGPLFLNLINGDKTIYNAFTQFGIVLLLFVIGLSLNFHQLKKIGKISILVGLGQLLFTTAVGLLILSKLGFGALSAFYLAVAITFSSTIIILKLLADKKDTESVYGRYTIGLMLVQDLIAILIVVGLGLLNNGYATVIPLTVMLERGILLIVGIYLISKFILPIILDRVAESGEFLFIFTVSWCFGIASLVYWSGFSLEIGAIIAGLTLGSSTYQPEIVSRIKPLRDFFIVLFFVILGSEMGLTNLRALIVPGLLVSLFILTIHPLILYILFRLAKFTRRNSFLVSLSAAQVSEFGFVLLFTGQQLGHLSAYDLSFFTFVALVTIFVSSYLVTFNEEIYKILLPVFRKFGKDKYHQINKNIEHYDVWVFGYHRIGWKVVEALKKKKVKFAVVDFNPEVVAKLKRQNIPAYFGDAADVEFLELLPLIEAKLVILTMPEPDDQKTLINFIRRSTKKTLIIANLYHYRHADELYEAGANYIMLPHLLGGQWIADILKKNSWTSRNFINLRKAQEKDMRQKM